MAIGTWVTQNKVRPGVYINYVFSEAELINYASEGVLALNYALPLNPQGIIEITAADIKNKSLQKYGVVVGSDAYKYLTTLLKYSSKLIVYSPFVTGGESAALSITGEFVANAKFVGVEGNKLAVEVVKNTNGDFVFNSYYNNELVAIQTLPAGETDLVGDNDYIEIVITGTGVTEAIPTILTGGLDGTVDMARYSVDFLEQLYAKEVEVLVINFNEEDYDFSIIEDFINNYNENHVQKIVVVYPKTDDTSVGKNSEFVIALASQEATLQNGLTISNGTLAGYVGALQAGADYKTDLTFTLLEDIVSITELNNASIEDNIKKGIMNLSLRSDRSVVIEDDINSLMLLNENQSSALKANDTLRLLNDLSYRIVSFGENVVIGKKKLTETTLNLVKAFVVGVMNEYMKEQVVVNFDSNNDVTVVYGEQTDGILCTIAIQKTNSAKKLYFSIGVR